MREILFRGKPKSGADYKLFSQMRKNNCIDGFVYGSLIVSKGKYYICVSALCSVNSLINNGITTMIEVDPSTVGQFTGLTDKNGKKIFEGDILRYWSEKKEEYVGYCVVEYGMFNCSCCSGVYGWYLRNGDIRYCETEYGTGMYEVCGNIHDNPELLEVSGDE